MHDSEWQYMSWFLWWGTLHRPIMYCIEMVAASCKENFLQAFTIISCNSMGLISKSVDWSCFWDNQLWFAILRTSPQTQWGDFEGHNTPKTNQIFQHWSYHAFWKWFISQLLVFSSFLRFRTSHTRGSSCTGGRLEKNGKTIIELSQDGFVLLAVWWFQPGKEIDEIP